MASPLHACPSQAKCAEAENVEVVTRLNVDHFKHLKDPSVFFSDIKKDLLAASGEFFGTFTFLLLGLGGVQAAVGSKAASLATASSVSNSGLSTASSSVPTLDELVYISTAMGLSLLFSAWIFFRATGAAFNPNVSFALLLIGGISPVRFVLYTVAQLSASIASCAVLNALIPGPLAVAPSLGGGTSRARGLFIEAFITAALVLSVMFMAVEKHRATHLAPVGIGLALFACHLFAVPYTGAAMNTARAFGPSVISGFSNAHWIYWLGPTMGSVLAVSIYAFMKRFRYWEFNQGQDTDKASESPELFIQVTEEAKQGGPNGLGRRDSLYKSIENVSGNQCPAACNLAPMLNAKAHSGESGRPDQMV